MVQSQRTEVGMIAIIAAIQFILIASVAHDVATRPRTPDGGAPFLANEAIDAAPAVAMGR